MRQTNKNNLTHCWLLAHCQRTFCPPCSAVLFPGKATFHFPCFPDFLHLMLRSLHVALCEMGTGNKCMDSKCLPHNANVDHWCTTFWSTEWVQRAGTFSANIAWSNFTTTLRALLGCLNFVTMEHIWGIVPGGIVLVPCVELLPWPWPLHRWKGRMVLGVQCPSRTVGSDRPVCNEQWFGHLSL